MSDTEAFNPEIIISSSDGVEFKVRLKVLEQAKTLKQLVENFGYDKPGAKIEPLPLENMNGATLKKVVEWMQRYKNKNVDQTAAPPAGQQAAPIQQQPPLTLDAWDREFLQVINSEMFNLVSAANYLDLKTLFDAICLKIGMMIKGKTAEVMRTTFNMKSDEEREAARLAEERAAERAEYGEDDDDDEEEEEEDYMGLYDDEF